MMTASETGQEIGESVLCSAVYDSTRKMLVITGDRRIFEIPVGFSKRLHSFLDATLGKM